MQSITTLSRPGQLWNSVRAVSRIITQGDVFVRWYAKDPPCDTSKPNPACRRASADIKPDVDPNCPVPCETRNSKKKGILHRIKLRVIEGGTNFGTPFRRLKCQKIKPKDEEAEEKGSKKEEPKALSEPKRVVHTMPPPPRAGVQVSVLGADTAIGQYVALLLKQCPCIKKLRLYEAKDSSCCTRDLSSVVQDLQHINTNCLVQAFSCCACCDLERCLQNTDIVLMLETGDVTSNMPLEKRFYCQAPIVKQYADVIANECPKAFIIVCTTPIDCMVPLIAETLKVTGWYDPRKLLGSLAVPEMRASTLAAKALSLEPWYTRVPCVGGTEGETLVPMFSKAVEYFDFTEPNAHMLTDVVRKAPEAVSRCDGPCSKAADLSEAHALYGLVTKVAHALLCHDVPRVTGFVETDPSTQLVSPAKYFAHCVDIGGSGIRKTLGFPHMSPFEVEMMNYALMELPVRFKMVEAWCQKFVMPAGPYDAYRHNFFTPGRHESYLAIDCLLNNHGVCKRFDFPCHLSNLEIELLETALKELSDNVTLTKSWFCQNQINERHKKQMTMQTNFQYKRHFPHLENCAHHLT